MTKGGTCLKPNNEYYFFEPNIQPNFQLVNFDALVEKVKICYKLRITFTSIINEIFGR